MNYQSYTNQNYRGNTPGHDSYLRSDSQQPSSSISQTNMGQNTFQPTGYVSSVYGQNQQSNQNQFLNQQPQFQSQFLNQSPVSYQSQNQPQFQNQQFQNQNRQGIAAFHAANYRGDQPGHDQYLRGDSSQPSQQTQGQYGFAASGITGGYNASFANQMNNQMNTQQGQYQRPSMTGYTQQQSQYQSPESFHTANYKGNQPGHDINLRSDSSQPGPSQFAGGVPR